jgi:hypothetical protein
MFLQLELFFVIQLLQLNSLKKLKNKLKKIHLHL